MELNKSDITDLAKQIQGYHVILALLTQQPIFQLSDGESLALAQAIAKVQKHYSLDFDTPRAAVIGLIVTAAPIYGIKFMQIRSINLQRRAQEQPAAPATPQENAPVPAGGVVDFTGEKLNRALQR